MKNLRRSLLKMGCIFSLPTHSIFAVAQQIFPSKPIQFFLAFGAGNAGDLVARVVAKKLGEKMGQSIVIENRPAPMVAASAVAKAKPDGYSMLMTGSGMALTHSLFHSTPYDILKDFVHVSTMAEFDLTLLVNPTSKFKNISDVVNFAKANPGKLNMATARIGSTSHLAAELFKSTIGLDLVLVPYKTTGEIISAIKGDQVNVAMELLPAVIGMVKQQQLRLLAVTSKSRFVGLPNVPTLVESGFAGFEISSWNGFSVPASTPPSIVQRLAKEIASTMKSPEVVAELIALGATPVSSSPEQMTERMQSDVARWRAIIARSNVPKL